MTTSASGASSEIRLRRATEDDYAGVAPAAESWWDDRRPGERVERLWFRHFGGTSWLAEDARDGALIGFLAGFRSTTEAGTAVVQSVAVHPARRRQGIGRALVERFVGDVRTTGVSRVEAVSWPGNRRAVRFLIALDFQPEAGPATRPLFGTPAFTGYDFGTEDRARFTREL